MIDAASILQTAGLRRTPVRVRVIELLHSADRPQSVQDIVSMMAKGTDVVTVYRTLNTLVTKKLARRVRSEDRSWLFEPIESKRNAEHVHPHFVCDSCGTVECLADVDVPAAMPRSAKLSKGYEITKQELTLHGVCPRCH